MKRLLFVALFALAQEVTSAQTYTVLHTFTGGADGAYPNELVTNSGAIFGLTGSTLFKINPNGTGYSVVANSFSVGYGSPASIVSSGNWFYGTTSGDEPQAASAAAAFKIMTNGSGLAYTTNLATGLSANLPSLSLLSGNTFFGTSWDGGAHIGNGTVFALNTNGTNLQILKTFSALVSQTNSDGANPSPWLVPVGNVLFGTAFAGGPSGQGLVFCETNDGSGFAVIKSFPPLTFPWNTNNDGAQPYSQLALGGSTLFGTTTTGGSSSNGVIFSLNTDRSGYTVLKAFSATVSGTNSDGAYPTGIMLNGRTLYGTTQMGGSAGKGVVFSMDTNGTGFTVLKNFGTAGGSSPADGATPNSGLVLIRSTLYGTTQAGGTNSYGVLFSLTVPPEILNDANFGVLTNAFGFDFTGVYGDSMVVEATTNLGHSNWVPLATNTLGTDPVYFKDIRSTFYPERFYRVRGK